MSLGQVIYALCRVERLPLGTRNVNQQNVLGKLRAPSLVEIIVVMQLSDKSLRDLREILRRQLGDEAMKKFTDEGLNDLGVRFIRLMKAILMHEAEKRGRVIRDR